MSWSVIIQVCFSGSPTSSKEVRKPDVSSAAGRQVSAPDVVSREVDSDAEQSSDDVDGWDDAWDDEEKWGDMEVR